MDYELWELNSEQKDVYAALECLDEDAYEELEDDFVLLANDGVVPLKPKITQDEQDQKELKKIIDNEYTETDQKEDFGNMIGLTELKSIIQNDKKNLGLENKNFKKIAKKSINLAVTEINDTNVETVIAEVKEESTKPDDEIKIEDMNMLQMEAAFKLPNKHLEVLEEKVTRMQGGGMLVFKRVKNKKKAKKQDQSKTFAEDKNNNINEVKEESKQVPEQFFSKENEKEYVIADRDSDAVFSDSDDEKLSGNMEFPDVENMHPMSKEKKKMNKKKENDDEFFKKMDRMMAGEEIIGLSSSEDEEEGTGEFLVKQKQKSELLKELEEDYEKQILKNIGGMGTAGGVIANNFKFKKHMLKKVEEDIEEYVEPKNLENNEVTIDGEKLIILLSKEDRIKQKNIELEKKGINEYLKKKGLVASKEFITAIINKEEKAVPTMAEYFGTGKEEVGFCDVAPQTVEMHQNIFCMQIVSEELVTKQKSENGLNKAKRLKKEREMKDMVEVKAGEDVAKKLKRKKKETKEERKLRKQMIKDLKSERKEKKRVFKDKFEAAKKDRLKQETRDKELGTMKGVPCYKIN